MALPKYATKEEVQLALIAYDNLDIPNHPIVPKKWITEVGPSPRQWERLLKTTAKLYEILESLQGSLRLLEESLMDSESRKANEPVSGQARALPGAFTFRSYPGYELTWDETGKSKLKKIPEFIQFEGFLHSWNIRKKKPEGGYAE